MLIVEVENRKYELEFDTADAYVASDLAVAYCTQLAEDFMPVIFDPRDRGSKPYPPELIGYRLVLDTQRQKLCALYEVYWRRQDCTWKELNKDHDHDYEQIQVHFNLENGEKEKIVVSSVGPVENAGHGIEIYYHLPKAAVRAVEYTTSSEKTFPWGGKHGQKNTTQIREIPIEELRLENGKPAVTVLNCYHAFSGVKRQLSPDERKELKPKLERLDRRLLERWYYHHAKNRFGHDVSKPFEEPHVMYYPPPEDWLSRLAYSLLWLAFSLRRAFQFQ
jgi:hypothetical protein